MRISRILIGVLWTILILPVAWAEPQVESKTGERRSQPFTYEQGKLTFQDGKTLVASEVRQILFRSDAGTQSGKASDSETIAGILKLASDAAVFEARYPDAGGVILQDLTRYVYRPDGTWSVISYFLGKVKKEDHREWANQIRAFTEGRERVIIRKARSINPDGTVLELDTKLVKASKPQTPPGLFLKYNIVSARIPGVQVGSLVETEIEQETYNPYHREFFFPINFFQSAEPVLVSRMEVEIPAAKTLFWEARNFPAGATKGVETAKGPMKHYLWEVKESPPLLEEPLMPKAGDAMPYVQASLFEGWDKVFDWILPYWEANTKPSPELASQAMALTRDLKTEDEKVAKIFHWIEKNIRYIIIKGDAATVYGSYPAHETVSKQYGCCVDKALVLSAMLNAIGVKNGPLLINVMSQEMSRRIPNLNITHSISRVTRPDGKKYYLDSTGYDMRYPALPTADQGRLCLDPFDRSMDLIPMQDPQQNFHHIVSTMTLDLNGLLTVQTLKEYAGEMEAGSRARMKAMKSEEREQFLSQRISTYGKGGVLASFSLCNLEDVEKPYSYTFSYQINSYPREIADLLILRIPGVLDYLTFPEAGLATRTFPIEYETTEREVEEGVLSLPEGLAVRSLPDPVQIENPVFRFSGVYQADGERTIRYRFEYTRLDKRVAVSSYLAFKQDIQKIEQCRRDRIFLTRVTKGGRP